MKHKTKTMFNTDLNSKEFNEYYQRYIDKLPSSIQLREGFVIGKKSVVDFFQNIDDDKLLYRYAPEKWSIKEVLQHLIDTERIFMYRCFRIARKDNTPLAGFDQNLYIEPSGADKKSKEDLLNEFLVNRNHSIQLINSLSDECLSFIGNASENDISARAAAFIVLGHDIWHMDVIKEKYL